MIGLKVHEDWGATPSALSHALDVADEFDVQIALHADTLNEAGFMEDTMAAVKTVFTCTIQKVLVVDMRQI